MYGVGTFIENSSCTTFILEISFIYEVISIPIFTCRLIHSKVKFQILDSLPNRFLESLGFKLRQNECLLVC
jgi:hypothetical protein